MDGGLPGVPGGFCRRPYERRSIANLVGIVTASEAHGLKAKDFDRAVVYLGEQTHHAIDKALRIAGLKESLKRFVPLDGRHRMRPESLEAAVEGDAKAGLRPWLICSDRGHHGHRSRRSPRRAGDVATVTGSGCTWTGLMGHLSPYWARKADPERYRAFGLVVLDPHKGCSCRLAAVLVREGSNLLGAHHYDASYLQDKDTLPPGTRSLPRTSHRSSPSEALRLWLPLKLRGRPISRRAGGEACSSHDTSTRGCGSRRAVGPFRISPS